MPENLLDAIWTIHWHTGKSVRLYYHGSHSPVPVIQIGEHEFVSDRDNDRLIAWAASLRDRIPNAPLPEPPPDTEQSKAEAEAYAWWKSQQ